MPPPANRYRTLLDSTGGTVACGPALTVMAAAVLARLLALGHP